MERRAMDVIREFWGLIMGAIGGVFWLARLEGRVNALDKQAERDRRDSRESRNEMKDMIRDVQKDIKRILERLGGLRHDT